MGFWDDVKEYADKASDYLTETSGIQSPLNQYYSSLDVSVPRVVDVVSNNQAIGIFRDLERACNKAIADAVPKYPLDPGTPGITTIRNLLGRIIELRRAAESYPGNEPFPLMSDLKQVADMTRAELISIDASVEARNKVVEKLGTDIKTSAEDVVTGIIDWTKIFILVGGVVVGYLVYKEVKGALK